MITAILAKRAKARRRSTTTCATGWCPGSACRPPDPDRALPVLRRGACPTTRLVVLPDLRGQDLVPRGVSPLAAAEDWVNIALPGLPAAPAKRDTDTMDTFINS